MSLLRKLLAENSIKPSVITYTTTDGNIITPKDGVFLDAAGNQAKIVSNTYENGQGKMEFDRVINEFGKNTFSDIVSLTNINIPESVKIIGPQCFYECRNLMECNFANNIERIGYYCFVNALKLKSVFIGSKIKTIGASIFDGTQDLNSITVDSSNPYFYSENNCILTKGTNKLIAGCNYSVIPDTTQEIVKGAFVQLRNFANIFIPKSLQTIESGAFEGSAASLTGITVDDENQYYKVDSGCLIENATDTLVIGTRNGSIPDYIKMIDEYAFAYMTLANKNIVIVPDTTKEIGDFAFRFYNSSNSNLIIGSSVTYIGHSAFSYSNWGNIIVKAITPPKLYNDIFADCYYIGNIYVSDSSIDAYKTAYGWSAYAGKIKPLSEYQE